MGKYLKEQTRTGDTEKVLAGIQAIKAQGFEYVKTNAPVLKERNDSEISFIE